ncbi:MAG: hypothetical protein ABLQ96_08185, partial [Candidatus Acidiferrum sp.]
PERGQFARELARKLAEIAIRRQARRQGLLISEINGAPAREHLLAGHLVDAGFVDTVLGYQMRRSKTALVPAEPEQEIADEDSADIQESA